MEWLLEPLNYEFMRYSLAMGIVVGLLCPVMGSFPIVQRLALLGNVISHSVLPGLAIANFIRHKFIVGAICSGMLKYLSDRLDSDQNSGESRCDYVVNVGELSCDQGGIAQLVG